MHSPKNIQAKTRTVVDTFGQQHYYIELIFPLGGRILVAPSQLNDTIRQLCKIRADFTQGDLPFD